MGLRKDDRSAPRDPRSTLTFRGLAVLLELYFLMELVKAYRAGGEDAPSLGVLILGIVVLGGGAVLLCFLAWREWKKAKEESGGKDRR